MRYVRKWSGGRAVYPTDPDVILSKVIQWRSGPLSGPATAAFPEPCNLVAAAAWTKIPQEAIEYPCFIYKDKKTKLWVMAVASDLIKTYNEIFVWHDKMLALNADCTWYYNAALPPRRKLSYIDASNEQRAQDPISSIHLLHQNGKFTIAGQDMTKLYPELFQGVDGVNVPTETGELTDYRRLKKPKQESKLPEQRCGGSKCVTTPHGIYASATEAGKAIGRSPGWVSIRAMRDAEGYKYISREEYLRLKALNTSEQNAEQSSATGVQQV